MRWPWQKPEKRNYTDSITASFVAAAEGGVDSAPLATAALEACAGLYARCLAAADVDASGAFKRALTPSVLAQIGRDMIRSGESFFVIEVNAGRLELRPQSFVYAQGKDADPMGWTYRATETGPTDSLTRLVPATQMIHVRYATDRARPWQGLPPWAWASATGGAIAGLDTLLSREARAPHGTLLGFPESPQVDADGAVRPLDSFRQDLAKAQGATLILENAAAWSPQAGMSARSAIDKTELGFDRSLIDTVRTSVGRDVLSACGVSPSLFASNSDGTAQRESFRRFMHSSLVPITKIIAEELERKFETPITLDLSGLHAADIAGRARAYGQLTKGGMKKSQAAKVVGISLK